IDDPGEGSDHQASAVAHVRGDVRRRRIGEQVGGRGQDHAVSAEVVLGVGEVDGDVIAPQPLVPGLDLCAMAERDGGPPREVLRPVRLPVPQDRHVGLDAGAAQVREAVQARTELGDLAPDPAAGAGMRDHRRVELLGPLAGGAPLEEHHRIGSAPHVREGVAGHLAGLLGDVAVLPVDPRGGVLHEHPRAAAGDRSGEVGVEGQLDEVPLVGRDQVVVVGDHVDLVRPRPQIDVRAGVRHEVRGHRDVRGDLVQHVPLRAEAVEDLGGAEAAPVELERGVLHRGGGQRGVDVLRFSEDLPPEGGAPGGVDAVQRPVALERPAAERLLREGREALADGRAVLVVHVPEREGGMVPVALGQGAGDAGGRLAVGGGRGAGHAARARAQRSALAVDHARLGMVAEEPGRGSGCGRAQVDADPGLVQQREHLVEPPPVELPAAGLEARPGEHPDADQVHAGLAHQAHVLDPGLAGPLLGVVVAAVGESLEPDRPGGAGCGGGRGPGGGSILESITGHGAGPWHVVDSARKPSVGALTVNDHSSTISAAPLGPERAVHRKEASMSRATPPRPGTRPSRRQLLRSGAGLGTAGLVGGALAGCGSTSSSAPVELTFWTWAPGIEEVVALWNQQNPDVQVLVSRQDAGDAAVTKLLTAVRAGNGAPDVVQAEYQSITSLVAFDAIDDISEDLDPGTAEHFAEGIWSSVGIGDGGVYAIPQDTGPLQFYYREDVFEDLGLSAPETWEDYAEAARAVHEADPSMYLGTFSSTDPGLFVGLAQQAGASWWEIEGERWKVAIDAEPTRRVAEFWGGLVEEGVIAAEPMYTPQWNAAL